MKFFIREWNENTIVLMTGDGHVLSYFPSISEALNACAEWYNCNEKETSYEVMVQYKQDKSDYSSITAMAS